MLAESIFPGHLKSDDEHRREVCIAGRWIHSRHFVVATDGNISVRLDPARILASPTAISKGMMTPDDLVTTDLQGQRISGHRAPSSELAMHLLIYRRRPEINAVCHAHPPMATGYAAAGLPLNKAILSEAILTLGCVPVAPYAMPGTPELCESLDPLVRSYNAILMANHGVVTCGPDLLTAFFRMETVEHFAHVSLVTELLGRQNLLSGGDVEKLLAARARYGVSMAPQAGLEFPVTSETQAAGTGGAKREKI